MNGQVPPRIYCIPATKAPVVAVFRRGPTDWCGLGRWDIKERRYERGAWLRGRLFPRRSDLSPDGRYLCYFAHKVNAVWAWRESYIAVSKLPWLTALHAFGACGTWTRGYYFSEDAERGEPECIGIPIPYKLRPNLSIQFASERRRGWIEMPDCPQRDPADIWDQRRNARMQKRQPSGDRLLCVESVGHAGGEFGLGQATDGLRVSYWLEADGEIEVLGQLQWADWDPDGRLLVATRDGKLQVWDFNDNAGEVLFEEDLCSDRPHPESPPDWAQRW